MIYGYCIYSLMRRGFFLKFLGVKLYPCLISAHTGHPPQPPPLAFLAFYTQNLQFTNLELIHDLSNGCHKIGINNFRNLSLSMYKQLVNADKLDVHAKI